jgi:hypothetical protein
MEVPETPEPKSKSQQRRFTAMTKPKEAEPVEAKPVVVEKADPTPDTIPEDTGKVDPTPIDIVEDKDLKCKAPFLISVQDPLPPVKLVTTPVGLLPAPLTVRKITDAECIEELMGRMAGVEAAQADIYGQLQGLSHCIDRCMECTASDIDIKRWVETKLIDYCKKDRR